MDLYDISFNAYKLMDLQAISFYNMKAYAMPGNLGYLLVSLGHLGYPWLIFWNRIHCKVIKLHSCS